MDPAVPQMVSFPTPAAATKAGTDKIVAMWELSPFADNMVATTYWVQVVCFLLPSTQLLLQSVCFFLFFFPFFSVGDEEGGGLGFLKMNTVVPRMGTESILFTTETSK